jgi:hypothetical protein
LQSRDAAEEEVKGRKRMASIVAFIVLDEDEQGHLRASDLDDFLTLLRKYSGLNLHFQLDPQASITLPMFQVMIS